jgi:hypothetical protein
MVSALRRSGTYFLSSSEHLKAMARVWYTSCISFMIPTGVFLRLIKIIHFCFTAVLWANAVDGFRLWYTHCTLCGIADAFLARSMGGLFLFEWRWSTYLIALPLSVSGRKDSCSVRERLCILESYEKIGCTTLKCRLRSALVQILILIPET